MDKPLAEPQKIRLADLPKEVSRLGFLVDSTVKTVREEEKDKRDFLTPDVVSFYDCDVRPTFFRSSDPAEFLRRWVYTYLRYPQDAVDEGVQGRVLVDFVIDERGKVGHVKVARGVDPRLDDEAVRVVAASPDWKPGMFRGKKVKTAMSVYVEFRLEKRKKKR